MTQGPLPPLSSSSHMYFPDAATAVAAVAAAAVAAVAAAGCQWAKHAGQAQHVLYTVVSIHHHHILTSPTVVSHPALAQFNLV